jgi:hypothetical protein
MSGHKQQAVANPFDGRQVDVDEELVPVLENLWSRDIETVSSCQGHPGYDMAVICFADPRGYEDCVDAEPYPAGGSKRAMARWERKAEKWQASQPNAARQVYDLLASSPEYQVYCARWTFTFDDGLNPGSALLLPPEDLPILTTALQALPGASPDKNRVRRDMWDLWKMHQTPEFLSRIGM